MGNIFIVEFGYLSSMDRMNETIVALHSPSQLSKSVLTRCPSTLDFLLANLR